MFGVAAFSGGVGATMITLTVVDGVEAPADVPVTWTAISLAAVPESTLITMPTVAPVNEGVTLDGVNE